MHILAICLSLIFIVSLGGSAPLDGCTQTKGSVWYTCPLTNSSIEGNGAVCLDGSPYFYFYKPATSASANTKWSLEYEGGGWCYSEEDCLNRSKTILGSSKNWTSTFPRLLSEFEGMWSQNKKWNPDFYDWNFVWFPYCDGASFAGNKKEPIIVNNQTIYMRGARILQFSLQDLLNLRGISTATEVIVNGGSAGGLAVVLHLDAIAQVLPGSVVRGIAEAGYFLNFKDVRGNDFYRNRIEYVVQMQEVAPAMNQRCSRAFGSADRWRCFFTPYAFPFVSTDLFILNSMYDTWQMENIISPVADGCPDWTPCASDPSQCNASQLKVLQEFHDTMVASFKGNSVRNVYASSCFAHGMSFHNNLWLGSSIKGVTMQQAVHNWYTRSSSSVILIDDPYPSGCAKKVY